MQTTAAEDQIKRIVGSDHWDPFQILGAHPVEVGGSPAVAVRVFNPHAREVWVVEPGRAEEVQCERVHPHGFFEAVFPGREEVFPYELRIVDDQGVVGQARDPYSFPPILTDYDLHLIGEGTHYKNYEKLGAHVRDVGGVRGVHFAVWAPNAMRVSVIGDFNRWDGRCHPMRVRGSTGIWEIFIPGLVEGKLYKFEIKSKFNDYIAIKADPLALQAELRPKSASIVRDIDTYHWNDADWMERRAQTNWFERPISIYEVHLGSWMRGTAEGNRMLNYRELADRLCSYANDMGYTHIELMPVMEHPFDGSWGYQTIGHFAPTSRHGTPEDFMYFVDRLHQAGIGVILDWAPAHFPKDAHGLAYFDGTWLYEHADPRRGEHRDWGTLIFNYGRNEIRNFLLSNALFWLERYHIDGLRTDAVASMLYLDYSRRDGDWIPNRYGGNENLEAIDFIKKFNEVVHLRNPGVLTIAEESTAWPGVSRPTYLGGLGFSMKWNMGWMNDMLEYISKDAVHRKYHHNALTFGLLYAFTENFILVLSHDEVVHGKQSLLSKMPGDVWQKFANLRLFYGFMFGHPGKKLLFMGGEFGQWSEWRYDHSLDWHLLEYEPHQKLKAYVRDLNHLYHSEPALHEVDFSPEGFEWIDFHDSESSVISFIRRAKKREDFIVFVCNFTPVPRTGYRIGVPVEGFYREILNSDSAYYGGGNMGNGGGVHTKAMQCYGRPYCLNLSLPPLATIALKLDRSR